MMANNVDATITVKRQRKHKGVTPINTDCYLRSLPLEVELTAKAERQYWHIENIAIQCKIKNLEHN